MKKIFITIIITALFLSGCSTSKEENYANNQNASNSSLINFDALDEEAHEKANSSFEITSGDFYNSISSIYSNVKITDVDDSVNVYIYLTHDSIENDSFAFLYIADKILSTCSIEDNYSGIVLSMFVDNSYVGSLTLASYNSYTSYFPTYLIFDDSYNNTFETMYSESFLTQTIGNIDDSDLTLLKNTYGILE